MISRKTSTRTKQQANLGVLITDLKKLSDRIHTTRIGIRNSIGDDHYCRDLDRLSTDITELNRIIFELENSGRGAP